ncbi:hypothetical protein LINPERPRIM_LOCUS16826 [Linum perenne]
MSAMDTCDSMDELPSTLVEKWWSFYDDNEELESERHNKLSGSDPEAEVSVVPASVGVIHLIDDSDRTSDSEFLEAVGNLGVSRVRTILSENGEEVDQLNEPTVNRRHQTARAREEIVVDENVMVELATMEGNDGILR